ncbi:MAG: sigma-70 family RNA polymerase sigma factor [Cytophagales bacterium]|nr:MAG: sigma-70 family RNA polymerase sigma factor [Cytophagales bacterium]
MEPEKQFSDKALRDFALIDLAKENDQKAYAELMDRYRKPVYYTILKMVKNVDDAEDLTIEAFAKAFKGLSKFKKEYSFSTWLFRIATNNCIDFIRKKKLETFSISSTFKDDEGGDVVLDIKDGSLDPHEKSIKSQKIEVMQMIVSKLPAKYQRLVKLRYFQELSYEEIAKEVDIPLGTVKAQLHRAKELLYDMIKNKKDHI